MNRELLAIRPELPLEDVRTLLHSFGVGAAPVLDDTRRPLGVVSLRDLVANDRARATASDRMSRPALCVATSTAIDDAARQLAETDMHHFVVVDATGSAVGMVSTLDLLRALVGVPTRHPSSFPHWDEATQVSWTDEWSLEEASYAQAPDGPGVLALSTGHLGERDRLVWVESCANVRARVLELSASPAQQEPALARALALRGLRFRAAVIPDEAARARIAALLRDRLDHVPPPGAT